MMQPQHIQQPCKIFSAIGLTLIELLVSVLLGSLLSLAISKIYLESVRNYIADEEMARIADNGRFSLTLLKRELMSAGFFASLPSASELGVAAVSTDCSASGSWALDIQYPLDFINNFDSTGSAPLRSSSGNTFSCLETDEIAAGTDIVSVKRTAGNFTVQNGTYLEDAVAKTNRWYLRVADYGAQKQWVYHRSGGFPSTDIGGDTKVDYWEYYARIFYIRKFSKEATDGIPTLCVENLVGGGDLGAMATRCLVEGVEDMQIEFGLDRNLDGTPNQLNTKLLKLEIPSVVLARIYLLMRSVGELPGYARSRTYSLGEKQVHRSDGYVRRVISTTVYIPNVGKSVG
jgi:type IV pilus assembly protein PilW